MGCGLEVCVGKLPRHELSDCPGDCVCVLTLLTWLREDLGPHTSPRSLLRLCSMVVKAGIALDKQGTAEFV